MAEDTSEMVGVNVPKELVDKIDDEYERRGYTSRSEAIRDALRSWIDPPVTLSVEILEDLAVSREQAKRGETSSAAEVRGRLEGEDDSPREDNNE